MGMKQFLKRFAWKRKGKMPENPVYIWDILAGRGRSEPYRETMIYPQARQWGNLNRQEVQYKATPSNIRYFTRTPFVRRAISRIRDPISSLAWEIVPIDGLSVNSHFKQQIQTATLCFNHPNNDDSWRSFIGLVTEDLLTFGAGVFEQQLGGDKRRPLWMWPVDAQSIQIYAGWSGGKNEARYIQSMGYTNVGLLLEGKKLTNDELVYIKTNDGNDTPFGFGCVEIAFSSINRKLGVEEFAGNLAANAQPQFMISLPGADANTLNAFRTWWRNSIEAQGQPPMWGGPKDAKPEVLHLYPGGDEALYLKYQEFLIREIATAFNLSPQNLGIESDVNRNTAEVSSDRDWDTAIKPICHLYENYITREVLHQKLGYTQLKFRFLGVDQEDQQALAETFEIEYKNNAITPNEYREKRNMPPLTNQFSNLTFADTQVAMMAARNLKKMEDTNLVDESIENKKTTSKKSVDKKSTVTNTNDQ